MSTQEMADTNAVARQGVPWRNTAALPRVLRDVYSLEDFEAPARAYIPRPIFAYVAGAAERHTSLRNNRDAFDDYAFVPRILNNTSARSTQTSLFGRTYDAPFGTAPMGGVAMAAYQGDVVLAKAAAEANIPMILSGASLTPLENVAKAGRTAWFQAYMPGEEKPVTELVERVARAGFETLVVTVDVPVASNLETAVRAGFRKPFKPTLRLAWDGLVRPRWLFGMFFRTLLLHGMPHVENMGQRSPLISSKVERTRGKLDQLSWEHIALIRRLWKGNLVLKGVLNRHDAKRAKESGVDGVIVSNHGGRQLDGSVAPMRVLPGIVDAVGDFPVMIDSGFRRGTDVLKALALGARFVFVGRPMLYATAIAGSAGAHHAIQLLKDEIARDMALIGIASLDQVRDGRVFRVRNDPVVLP